MDFLAFITGFLNDLAEPTAGGRVYDAYASTAKVYCQFQVTPIPGIERERFAVLFQAADMIHHDDHPDTPRKPVILEPETIRVDTEGDDRALGWFKAREIHDDRPVTLAVGFRREDEAWKIEWLTLTDKPQAWRYGVGLAQALADSVYGQVSLAVMPRSWLDLAYFRLYDAPKPPLVTLPEAKFSCGMSGVCCHVDYSITVQPDAQAMIDAIPWTELGLPGMEGTVLEPTDNGKLKIKEVGKSCTFLDEHRHCVLHKHLGRPVFAPCAVFPFTFTPTPDGVAVAASPLCGSVRSNMGQPLSERTEDLYSRLVWLAAAEDEPPLFYNLTRELDIEWETFKEVEATLMAWLGREDQPIRRRLWVGSRYLSAIVAEETPQWESWLEEPADEVPDGHRANAASMIERFEALMGLSTAREFTDGVGSGPVDIEPVVQNILRNVLFSKKYSFDYSLTVGFNITVFMFLTLERLKAQYAPNPVPERYVAELAKSVMHGLLSTNLKELSSDAFRELMAILDQPEAGTWLLSCLADETAVAAS